MAEYISKDRARQIILEMFDDPEMAGWSQAAVLQTVHEKILEEPPAEVVEERRGRWVMKVVKGVGWWMECSECGARWMLDSKTHLCRETPYCHECGAKLEHGKEQNNG